MSSDKHICDQVLNNISSGFLLIDMNYQVLFWNRWMEEKTKISSDKALNKNLKDLFPGMNSARLDAAVEFVIQNHIPQIISQALNHFVLPIPISVNSDTELLMMQQDVTVSPIKMEDGNIAALISINDVTDKVSRINYYKNTIRVMEGQSTRDMLTDCYNRRFMWDWLMQEFKLAHRYQYPITCLLIDIDHFKEINDTYGHDAGDEVLKDLSLKLQKLLRESDVLVRYGGEEFLIVLPKCELQIGIEVAEKVRQYVETHTIGEGVLKGQSFTCSIGVVERKPTDPISVEELLKLVDTRLYVAKNAGRNRVNAG